MAIAAWQAAFSELTKGDGRPVGASAAAGPALTASLPPQIGFLGPAFFLSQLGRVTSARGAVFCMMASQGCDAFSNSGLYSNHQVRLLCFVSTMMWEGLICRHRPVQAACWAQCMPARTQSWAGNASLAVPVLVVRPCSAGHWTSLRWRAAGHEQHCRRAGRRPWHCCHWHDLAERLLEQRVGSCHRPVSGRHSCLERACHRREGH